MPARLNTPTGPQMRWYQTLMEHFHRFIKEKKNKNKHAEQEEPRAAAAPWPQLIFICSPLKTPTSQWVQAESFDRNVSITPWMSVVSTHSELVNFNLSSSCRASAAREQFEQQERIKHSWMKIAHFFKKTVEERRQRDPPHLLLWESLMTDVKPFSHCPLLPFFTFPQKYSFNLMFLSLQN